MGYGSYSQSHCSDTEWIESIEDTLYESLYPSQQNGGKKIFQLASKPFNHASLFLPTYSGRSPRGDH
jgi:hypothetical protein